MAPSPGLAKEVHMVLGIEDPGVWLAYVLSLACAALCVGYGIIHWNKGLEQPAKPDDDDDEPTGVDL